MANKSLTDLTARTATADSDLIHVNSGGTDYKQTKSNFMHGSLAQNFEVTSTLTSQVDALPIDASYFGCLWNYGHVSVTGMPINALSYVRAVKANSDQFAFIEVWSALDPDGQHYIVCKNNGTWESSWTKCASKAEITSLNNSLTYRNGIHVDPGDNTLSSLSSCKFGILYGRYSGIWFSMAFDVASLEATHQMFISANAHCNFIANLSTNKFTVSGVVGFDSLVVVLYK